jgi:hypothetical protein
MTILTDIKQRTANRRRLTGLSTGHFLNAPHPSLPGSPQTNLPLANASFQNVTPAHKGLAPSGKNYTCCLVVM